MAEPITLEKARRRLLALAQPGAPETIPLDAGLGRITAGSIRAELPVPSFDHATRDGYAAGSLDVESASDLNPITLKVVGEIPAGCTDLPPLARAQALRIMTGAAIPPGSDLVLAQEDIEIRDDTIIVSHPAAADTFIRKKGASLAKGDLVVRAGETLAPDHLALLATCGTNAIQVHRKPAVAVICTGSELVSGGIMPRPGQVISSNRLLLDGLIKNCGGSTVALTTVPDQAAKIAGKLQVFLSDQIAMIITTGGMGPGKYDLMSEIFAELKIKTVYESLAIRPGHATMLGIHGRTMIFALPGPPPAVRLLFNELVKPALLKLGGLKSGLTRSLRVQLTENIALRPLKNLSLRGGICFLAGDTIRVRPAGRTEKINCVIYLPPGRKHFKCGEKVRISPAGTGPEDTTCG